MRFGERLVVFILVSASLAETGCSCLCAKRDTRSEVKAQTQYEASIKDAAVVSPDKVLPLANLPGTETVRVARWVSDNRLICAAGEARCDLPKADGYHYWVVLADELSAKCRAWGLW